jgi:hypothetical protein
MATLVLTAVGEVALLRIVAPGNMARLAGMTQFGTWP